VVEPCWAPVEVEEVGSSDPTGEPVVDEEEVVEESVVEAEVVEEAVVEEAVVVVVVVVVVVAAPSEKENVAKMGRWSERIVSGIW